jgi:hyperosmotically inducible protein
MVPFAQGAVSTAQNKSGLTSTEKDVRHELVMLPYFGVFDNLEFQVNGNEVTLSGQVTRPTLKTDAERVVSRIEGVTKVVNNIEVLPLSPYDDQIRIAAYRSIYGFGPLSRYNWGPGPPIHIVVKNGNVTLAGVVSNETDRNMAFLRANGVSGVFSVDNSLKVEKGS